MTDRWFKEWMYQVAVDVEMLPADVAAILDQTPTVLPAWDPMVRSPTLCFATLVSVLVSVLTPTDCMVGSGVAGADAAGER